MLPRGEFGHCNNSQVSDWFFIPKRKNISRKILAIFFNHLGVLKIIWLFTQKGVITIISTSLHTLCFRANTRNKTFIRELFLEPASRSSETKTLYNTAEPQGVTWAGCRGPGLSGPPPAAWAPAAQTPRPPTGNRRWNWSLLPFAIDSIIPSTKSARDSASEKQASHTQEAQGSCQWLYLCGLFDIYRTWQQTERRETGRLKRGNHQQ